MDELLDLGTLASRTLIGVAFDETVNERTFISSIVASHIISEWTAAAGDGPVMVGFAHSDYSDSEIEAFIETTGSWNETDQIAQEVGKRKIKIVGTIALAGFGAGGGVGMQALNDGKPINTKLGWILTQGQTVRLWAYNLGDSAFASTDPDYNVEGHANLWPQ